MDSNAAWGVVEEGGTVAEGGPGVAEMGMGACTRACAFTAAESASGFARLPDLSPPSIGIIVNTAVLPLSEADALLCCPALLGETLLMLHFCAHTLGCFQP